MLLLADELVSWAQIARFAWFIPFKLCFSILDFWVFCASRVHVKSLLKEREKTLTSMRFTLEHKRIKIPGRPPAPPHHFMLIVTTLCPAEKCHQRFGELSKESESGEPGRLLISFWKTY